MILRQWRNAGTEKRQSSKSAGIKQSLRSSSRGIYNRLSSSSAGTPSTQMEKSGTLTSWLQSTKAWILLTFAPFYSGFLFAFVFGYTQYMEVPRPGMEPTPQQRPQPLEWKCWVLSPLSHKRTSNKFFEWINECIRRLKMNSSKELYMRK